MSEARIRMFLEERDRAKVRQDHGVHRSLTADLRRLGVSDDATAARPTGPPRAARENGFVEEEEAVPERNRGGRPKLPRCEHGQVADRCPDCNEELLAP